LFPKLIYFEVKISLLGQNKKRLACGRDFREEVLISLFLLNAKKERICFELTAGETGLK